MWESHDVEDSVQLVMMVWITRFDILLTTVEDRFWCQKLSKNAPNSPDICSQTTIVAAGDRCVQMPTPFIKCLVTMLVMLLKKKKSRRKKHLNQSMTLTMCNSYKIQNNQTKFCKSMPAPPPPPPHPHLQCVCFEILLFLGRFYNFFKCEKVLALEISSNNRPVSPNASFCKV